MSGALSGEKRNMLETDWVRYYWFWERRKVFVQKNPDFIPRPGEVVWGEDKWEYRRR